MTKRFLACIIFTLLYITPPASAQTLEFQKVFEQHGVVMMLIDPNSGAIVDANPAAAQFYGHERDELKSMTIQQINTLSAAQVAEERTLAQNEGRNYFIFRHRLADGEIRTVEVHSNPFTIAGRPLLLSLIHDIAPGRNLEQGMWHYQQRLEELVEARTAELEARHLQITLILTGSLFIVSITAIMLFRNRAKLKRIELDLRQQKALLKSLLDSTPDFIFYKNLEGAYLGCNRPFAELVNQNEQDIIGKADYDLFDKEIADFFREQDRLMLKQGQPRRNDEWVTWPDGQKVLLDTLKTPYRGPDDELIGLLGISRDITERKQAEEALQESENRFRNLLKNIPSVAVQGYDEDGITRYWNQASEQLYGYRADEAMGRNLLDLIIPAEMHDGVREAMRGMFETKTPIPAGELSLLRKDGSRVDVFSSHAYVHVPERSTEIFCLDIDITERKQARLALQQKNEELEQFVYIVSHDLKSPLVTVKTFAGMLRQDILNADQPQIDEDLNFIDKATAKMQQLLDALLQYSRIGRIDTPAQTLSANQSVEDCLATLAGILQQHQVGVSTGDLHHQLHGDPLHFGQIWQNLVENAVKYRGDQPQPHIEIGSTQQGHEVIFYVRDNGMGIAPEHRERIFNLFSQLNPGSDGSGLGLALVKKIVTIYQGHIWVESKGAGRGSCFYFTMPTALII